MTVEEPRSLLLALPDECLVAVLQCCAAEDLSSLFSTSRSHSRLHQAAIAALQTISALVSQQQQADSMLMFLGKHGHHVDSLRLKGPEHNAVTIRQLPPSMRLDCLCLDKLQL
jgi:hypothetical protein